MKQLIVGFLVGTLLIILGIAVFVRKSLAQGYLPPDRYIEKPAKQRTADEPNEYYAEDWVVLDHVGRTVCINPYIRKDLKIIECVSAEKAR
jgi:hypothetical protein